jgi:CubicO group peptidase (beta-lactamase class C family)
MILFDQMKMNKTRTFILRQILLLVALLFCPSHGYLADAQPDYWPTKGWRKASPESQGVNSIALANMLEKILEKDFQIDSILVIRNGYLVLDAYRHPHDEDDSRHIQSISKSVLSALVGIAIDNGHLKGVNQAVLEFFPNRVAQNLNESKRAVTLENLLTMTHGLACNDLYQLNSLTDLSRSKDWVQQIIDLHMDEEPGDQFAYCNGAAVLLSAILQQQTGMNAFSYAKKVLFRPLGINHVHWPSNSQGITVGYNGLHLRPQDMAKIGYLYLNHGLWDGKRLISSQWIEASTREHIPTRSGIGAAYGYLWWIITPGIYTAFGAQGQYLMVAPEKNMVVVFTGDLSRKDVYIPLGLLSAYILPGVKSPTPLLENPKAEKALKSASSRWQHPTPIACEERKLNPEDITQRKIREDYVNSAYGFAAKYDANLLVADKQLKSPLVFRTRDLKGLPLFAVLVDDIPQEMELEYTADYLIDLYKNIFPTAYHDAYHKVKKEKRMKLSDGTEANYIEINWNVQYRGILKTVGVFTYKNKKLIGAVAGGMADMPIESLAQMATSLTFTQ